MERKPNAATLSIRHYYFVQTFVQGFSYEIGEVTANEQIRYHSLEFQSQIKVKIMRTKEKLFDLPKWEKSIMGWGDIVRGVFIERFSQDEFKRIDALMGRSCRNCHVRRTDDDLR